MWPLLILGGAYALLARRPRRNPDWYTDAQGRHHPLRSGDGRAGDATPYDRDRGGDSATPKASRMAKVEPPKVEPPKVEPPRVVDLSAAEIEAKRDAIAVLFKKGNKLANAVYKAYTTTDGVFSQERIEYLKTAAKEQQALADEASALVKSVDLAKHPVLSSLIDSFEAWARNAAIYAQRAEDSLKVVEAPKILSENDERFLSQQQQNETIRRKQVEDQKETIVQIARKARAADWRNSGFASKLKYLENLAAEASQLWSNIGQIYSSYNSFDRPSWIVESQKDILPLVQEVQEAYRTARQEADQLPAVQSVTKPLPKIIIDMPKTVDPAFADQLRTAIIERTSAAPKVEPPEWPGRSPSWQPSPEAKVYMTDKEATEHFTELKRQRDKKFAEQMRKNRQDPAIKALYEEEQARRERYYKVYNRPGYIKRALIASQSTIAANATAKQRKAAAFKAMRLEGVVDVRMLEDFWASYNYVGYIAGD